MTSLPNPADFEAIDWEIDDPEWRTYLGTSHAATFFNEHPFETAAEYWLRKAGLMDRPDETPQMRRGQYLESAIVDWWVAETGDVTVYPPHPHTRGPLASLPDRCVLDADEILSIKTAPYSYEDIERYWWWQAQGEMVVFDMNTVRIVWLDRRQMLQEYVVERDEDAGMSLFHKAVEFAFSLKDTPINADAMPNWVKESHTAASIIAAYPTPDGLIEADNELAGLLADYARLKTEGAEYDAATKVMRNEIAKLIGDAETVTINGTPVATFKATAGRTTFDTARFETEHEALYNSYLTTGKSTRSLRFPKAGAKILDNH